MAKRIHKVQLQTAYKEIQFTHALYHKAILFNIFNDLSRSVGPGRIKCNRISFSTNLRYEFDETLKK